MMVAPPGLSHRRVIIVGAGQAGLAVAAALRAEGLQPQHDFIVIDGAPNLHLRSWRDRRATLELLSDARHSAFPWRPLPGDQRRRVQADEMADYLSAVEAALGVETRWNVRATSVEHSGSGTTLLLSTSEGTVQTRNVVCATGGASRPAIPSWAAYLATPGIVIHSHDLRSPDQIPRGDVLIVGGGNTGVHLAHELAATHRVTLATRTPRVTRKGRGRAPRAGRPLWFAPRASRREPVHGPNLATLRRSGVTLASGVIDADGARVRFADDSVASPTSVVLATGYHPGDEWLGGVAPHSRRATLTDVPGLFVAGMPRFGRPDSATIAGAWNDATIIAQHIAGRP